MLPTSPQDLIPKMAILPPSALKELEHFIDYLYFSYHLTQPTTNKSNALAALAGSWDGLLEREPQGDYDNRSKLD